MQKYIWRIILLIVTIASGLIIHHKNGMINTMNSALDNTMDATTIQIKEIKQEKRAREAAFYSAQKQSDSLINNLCNEYVMIPHDYVINGTCNINK